MQGYKLAWLGRPAEMACVAARLGLGVLLSGILGCVATTAQLDRVEARVVAVERAGNTTLAGAQRETQRLENLSKNIDEALDQLREATARANSRQSDFEKAMKTLRGDMELLNHRLDAIEKLALSSQTTADVVKAKLGQLIADLRDRAGIAILALPSDLPADGPGFAAMAEKMLASGEVRTASAVAVECQKRFDKSEAAGSCGVILARIAEQELRFADAMKTLQAVHDSLGGKPVPVVGQALLQIAHLLELQGKCARAGEVYKYLRGEMAKLPAAKSAKDLQAAMVARCKEGVSTEGQLPSGDAKGSDKKSAETPEEKPTADKPQTADKAQTTDKAMPSEKPAADKALPADKAVSPDKATPAKTPAKK